MVDYLHLTPGEAQVLRAAEAYHAEELAEAIKRAEKAEADLRQYMAAAQKLCEIFFDIAAKHEPEPSIRRQVDSAVRAAKEKP